MNQRSVIPITPQVGQLGAARDHVRRLVAAGSPIMPCGCCAEPLPLKLTVKGGLYVWCSDCRYMGRIMSKAGANALLDRLSSAIADAVAALPPEELAAPADEVRR